MLHRPEDEMNRWFEPIGRAARAATWLAQKEVRFWTKTTREEGIQSSGAETCQRVKYVGAGRRREQSGI